MDRLVRKNGRLWKFSCGAHCGQCVLERDQNNFGSGPRELGQFRCHRIFHPLGSAFKTERFEMAKPYQGKNRNDTKPFAKYWEGTPLRCFCSWRSIVVGIVAYCARQQWWELYMSLTH